MKIIWTFTLLMIPGAMTSMSVTGHAGGEINITCTYQEKYTANVKYFCRGQWSDCTDRIRTKTKNKWVDSGRFSLFDDTRATVFTVTFRNLREQDSDTYWCAVDIPLSEDPNTEVKLKIISGKSTYPPPLASSSSSSSSPPSSITTPPVSLNSQPSTSDLTLSSPSINDSSLIIGVSVILLLLITGLVSFKVALCKKHQARDKDPDSDSKMSEPGTENSEAVPQMPYIYEEIKDTRPQTDCKTARLPTNPSDSTKTVYATPQLPTNPSASTKTVYATPQLPTNPSDSIKTVYATPQLPTNPADSTKTVYATPQLPTNPSDSIKTIYATPQLPTNPADSTKTVYATPQLPTNPL
ncbi:CMRF35-like molecule 8 [Cyprinus carpio]|uniref:CMRF35-like molecule 8 n=1 Tax=Cyprinus carpio TaxID=7962 RepID=A0A9R0B3L5_CYPCA|nr:CMRF35-like molecule 8 [Cyprinus carpio]